MSRTPKTYQIAFAAIRGIDIETAQNIISALGGEKNFFEMPEKELRSLTGGRGKAFTDANRRELLEMAEREEEFLTAHGVRATYFNDADYPRRLKEIPDAPLMLYSLGTCDLESAHVVSVVGTRNATVRGTAFCDKLVGDLAARLRNLVVVSGLAYGIDIAAHRACLKHKVPTVAVMAQGLNRIYPDSHRGDAATIVRSGGLLVSEYPSQAELHRGNFLARNRIIAGLSDCTVVVESAEKGGALVTASLAQGYNRDVFAVPGRVQDDYSVGCNRLIRGNQAGLITSADDLIAAMRWEDVAQAPRQRELFVELSEPESKLVNLMKTRGDMQINDIATAVEMPLYKVMSMLVDLECRGVVLSMPGCRYALA